MINPTGENWSLGIEPKPKNLLSYCPLVPIVPRGASQTNCCQPPHGSLKVSVLKPIARALMLRWRYPRGNPSICLWHQNKAENFTPWIQQNGHHIERSLFHPGTICILYAIQLTLIELYLVSGSAIQRINKKWVCRIRNSYSFKRGRNMRYALWVEMEVSAALECKWSGEAT